MKSWNLLIDDKLIKDRDRSIEFTPKFIEDAEDVTKKNYPGDRRVLRELEE